MLVFRPTYVVVLLVLAAWATNGCASSRGRSPLAGRAVSGRLAETGEQQPLANAERYANDKLRPGPPTEPDPKKHTAIVLVSNEDEVSPDEEPSNPPQPEEIEAPPASQPLKLDDVIDSTIASYPLLLTAMLGRNIAQGDQLSATGAFDLKLKADSMNMPKGFYENYRHSIGAEQPLFGGGSLFGGYRLGTGSFPSYYGERETNRGGELKAGIAIPLAQNRRIDDRRAELWRSRWAVDAVEPEIQAQLIDFIRAATITYWNWVAAGRNVQIAEDLLENATDRDDNLRTRVQRGDASPIELTDNERLIVSRRTKLIDAQRKFQQSAFKLSLFLRDASGEPLVVDDSRLPREFPAATDPANRELGADIAAAIANRPELRAYMIISEQLRIDLASASNLMLPQIDAVLAISQDVGNPDDIKKDDKSPFELEGGLIASVPLQRRKGQGKMTALQAKLSQVRAKARFTQDKIVAEVQSASAALNAAYLQLEQAIRSIELARQMEAAERRKFDLGESNLLLVNLREQSTADAASTEVEARLNYFDAQAEYRAAIASDVAP